MAEDKNAGAESPASPEPAISAAEAIEPQPELKAETAAVAQPAAEPEPAAPADPEPSVPVPAPPVAERTDTPNSTVVASKNADAPVISVPAKSTGRRVYEAGTMRKTTLSFVFLLLLPFFASMPAMIYQRVVHQLWADVAGFVIFAGAFALIMLLVVYELLYSIRSRVEIGEGAVRLSLPAARGVAMPKFFYRKNEIPYSDIDYIETRRELYGGMIAPVMLRGARIVTKSGEKIPLGYVNEANVDPALPVPEIASEIAARAGLQVIDRGTVRRQVRNKIRRIRAIDDPAASITEAEIGVLNRRHNNVMIALCGLLFLLVAGGLMVDIVRSNLDLGERAHQLIQEKAKPSPQAKRS